MFQLQIRAAEAKFCEASLLLSFWKELWCFEVKESMHFVDQRYKLSKTRIRIKHGKPHIPHKVLERQTLCFSSHKNLKLKVRLWWVGAELRKEKRRHSFVLLILSERSFFNICILSQCIVHWIHLYAYFYISKNVSLYTFLLVFEIAKSLWCILKQK